jgi:opacity protein-like surface antigen
MKRFALVAAVIFAVLMLSACAPQANAAVGAGLAGFWQGLWHGFILLFTFIISLFDNKVGIYEVSNNGGWYNFGYLLGVMMFWGGSGGGAARSSRRR